MKKKRILAMILAVASCLSLAVSASAASTARKATDFRDFDRTAWYADAVSAAVDNGLLYRGVAKLGVDALVLKTKGFDCKDIAGLYHTSSNNVGAWISRAAKKLRSDPDFLDAFDIAC